MRVRLLRFVAEGYARPHAVLGRAARLPNVECTFGLRGAPDDGAAKVVVRVLGRHIAAARDRSAGAAGESVLDAALSVALVTLQRLSARWPRAVITQDADAEAAAAVRHLVASAASGEEVSLHASRPRQTMARGGGAHSRGQRTG